jgi:uncharacterized protein
MPEALCTQPPAFNYITLQTTKACNLRCSYCYLDPSRAERKQKLSVETTKRILSDIVEYHVTNNLPQDLAVVFHGGEALILGHAYFREVLEHVAHLRRSTPRKRLLCSIQSNLTLLDDAYCETFKAHDVSIGTSLDGPPHLHNVNRFGSVAKDNHAKVMKKIDLARKFGLRVGALCLITKDKLLSAREVLDFFEAEGLNFKTNRLFMAGHAKENETTLNVTEAEYAAFTCELFDLWYSRSPRITVDNLMQIMGVVLSGRNVGGCSHSNCATKHVTVTPAGDLYTCGRTTQDEAFLLGNVEHTSFAGLARSPNFLHVARRNPDKIEECASCDLRSVCGSGCMYEAYLRHGTIFSTDGSCETFRKIYTHIQTKLYTELTHLSLEGEQHA